MSQSRSSTDDNLPNDVKNQTDSLFNYFLNTGILDMQAVQKTDVEAIKKRIAKRRYHNTLLLLSKYRLVLWALECVPGEIGEELSLPTKDLDALIQRVDAELAMNNKKIEYKIKGAAKTKMLIERVQDALWMLRKYPKDGAKMYELIYKTFIEPNQSAFPDLLNQLGLSERTYYRLRKAAIEIMSIRLWAAPSGETDLWLEILTLIEAL